MACGQGGGGGLGMRRGGGRGPVMWRRVGSEGADRAGVASPQALPPPSPLKKTLNPPTLPGFGAVWLVQGTCLCRF